MEKEKYNILVGRFTQDGSGSESVVQEAYSEEEAIRLFNKQVEDEKRDIAAYRLNKNEYIQITLEREQEVIEVGQEQDILDQVQIK